MQNIYKIWKITTKSNATNPEKNKTLSPFFHKFLTSINIILGFEAYNLSNKKIRTLIICRGDKKILFEIKLTHL